MKTLIQRFISIRKEERGFTIIEMVVTVAMLGLLMTVIGPPILTATEANNAMHSETLGINQGTEQETAQTVFEAGTAFKQSNPDEPLTKEALIASGFNLPANFVWNVGEYVSHPGLDGEICSIVYSTTDTSEFTADNPAQYAKDYEHDTVRNYACWTHNEEGKQVPNWS